MITKLNTENARAFNSSLKEAIKKLTNQKVKVEIINSYKFPNCYVRVHAETEFSNDFKLNVFDAFGNKRDGLLNVENVSYGNIQSKHITGKVFQWENLFNEINLKEFEKGGKMKEPTIVRGFSDDEPYEYANGGGVGEKIKIEVTSVNGKCTAMVDGRVWNKKPELTDVGSFVRHILFYTNNSSNKKDVIIILNKEDVTKEFTKQYREQYKGGLSYLQDYLPNKYAKGGGVKYAKGSTVEGEDEKAREKKAWKRLQNGALKVQRLDDRISFLHRKKNDSKTELEEKEITESIESLTNQRAKIWREFGFSEENKFAKGGVVDKRGWWHSDRRQFNKSENWEKPMDKRKSKYADGGMMAKGGQVGRGKNKNIKDWYIKNYPDDETGEELNDFPTFDGLWRYMNQGYSVYQVLGVGDSLIRERVFEHLAKVHNISYYEVYLKWLSSNKYAKGGIITGCNYSIGGL